jgi:plastocyanin
MKKLLLLASITCVSLTSNATIHIVQVWDGYFQFLSSDITIDLGDTVQWLPLDAPTMAHTITSTNIPAGAQPFDQIWQAPADTFFQYIPTVSGMHEYECTPHAVNYGMVGSINVIGTTGIPESDDVSKQYSIYPNPTSDYLNFDASIKNETYHIYSEDGKVVLSGNTDEHVNVVPLNPGIYFVRIIGDNMRQKKFVKK